MNLVYSSSKENKAFTRAYVLIFVFFYAFIPVYSSHKDLQEAAFTVAGLTILSVFGFVFGLNVSNSDVQTYVPRVQIGFEKFSTNIFILYLSIIVIIIATAGNVPLIESLKGASQYDLLTFREDFLKKREGWESYLAYAITLIDTAIFPYIIIYSFNIRYKYRYLFIITFLLYSISFLEKAYFLKIIIPLFFFFFYKTKNKKTFLIKGFAVIVSLFAAMFSLSKFDTTDLQRDEPFFSILYTPKDIFTALLWRSVAVPVLSVIDAMDLFLKNYTDYFYGATSSFLSFLFGLERSNFERLLYQSQFGGEGTGNTNQCYLIEAYINFGYIGILLFSFIVGRVIRGVINSKDIAALCIIPLFMYNLFNAGLIGLLFSNGYLLFFLMIKYVKIKE